MKAILLTFIFGFTLLGTAAKSATPGPFDKFLGSYLIVSKTCGAYKAMCEGVKTVQLQYNPTSSQPVIYLYLNSDGGGVGYPLQAYDWRERSSEGLLWGTDATVQELDAKSSLYTETRRVPDRPIEIDTKLISFTEVQGQISFTHRVRIMGLDQFSGRQVNEVLVSTYLLKKK